MDPQLAWEELLQAWVRRDWESVVEYAEALLSWLDRGGFPPEMLVHPRLGIDFNWSIARAACAFARQHVFHHDKHPRRILVEAEVPVEDIVSTPATGLGCLVEAEMVIKSNGPRKVKVIEVKAPEEVAPISASDDIKI